MILKRSSHKNLLSGERITPRLGLPALLSLMILLQACSSKRIVGPDEMREFILANRTSDVMAGLRAGFSTSQEVSFCFPILPFAAALKRTELIAAVLKVPDIRGDINQRNCMGQSALHFSYMTGNVELTKILIDSGADQNALDKAGRTPREFEEKRLK